MSQQTPLPDMIITRSMLKIIMNSTTTPASPATAAAASQTDKKDDKKENNSEDTGNDGGSDDHNSDSDNDDDLENDPDYDPNDEEDIGSEDSYSDEDDDMETDDDFITEDEDDIENMLISNTGNSIVLLLPPPPMRSLAVHKDFTRFTEDRGSDSEISERPSKRGRTEKLEEFEFVRTFTKDEKLYWKNLSEQEKENYIHLNKVVKATDIAGTTPMRFKFLNSDIDLPSKALILAKLDQFQSMHEGSGDYFKLRNWLQSASRLPLGKYHPLPVQPTDDTCKIAGFLQHVRKTLDDTVFGHTETKEQIMRIMAQWVSNPDARGHCIGIQGPPGIAKTRLVKEGICKALNLPFGFVALGGASDGAFLEGHGFTYEGSIYGKIAEILMKTQCMNPVFFFDELDKVSSTRRGEEIIGILTHLTDSTQNERFQDRYFGDIDMNLSKSLIIFSYNDESLINPILKDRMVTIHVKGYNTKEKVTIAQDYLLPEILQQYRLTTNDITISDELIADIISRVTEEEGVRNLKRGLESIVSCINMHRYIPTDDGLVQLPIVVTEEVVKKYLKRKESDFMNSMIRHQMYI